MKDKVNRSDTDIPTDTPWGPPQDIQVIAPGIVRIDTAGHGGIWLSPERNKKVPMDVKKKTFCQNGLYGWYEEDEDAEIVCNVFPEFFNGGEPLSDEEVCKVFDGKAVPRRNKKNKE